jgi:type IV secretory pathway VirB4 component
MMNLAEYRRSTTHLADFLPWAALVGEGVVLNKDGSFQCTAQFRGPDLESAVPAELVGVAGRLNNALRRLGSVWAVFVEAQRHPAGKYPESHFTDVASALVDMERRAEFEEELRVELLPDLSLFTAARGCCSGRALSLRG